MPTWSRGNNFQEDVFDFFAVAFVAAGIVAVLLHPTCQGHFKTHIPSTSFRILSLALIVFVVVYVVDRLMVTWRLNK